MSNFFKNIKFLIENVKIIAVIFHFLDKNLLNKPPENPGVFRAKIPRPRVFGKYNPPAPPPPPDRGPRGPRGTRPRVCDHYVTVYFWDIHFHFFLFEKINVSKINGPKYLIYFIIIFFYYRMVLCWTSCRRSKRLGTNGCNTRNRIKSHSGSEF